MKVEVSIGEVVDKATILAIKLEKIKDAAKRKNVETEFETLTQSLKDVSLGNESAEFKKLKAINLKLWEIEDQIRVKESKNEFDQEFIELARAVYFNNDDRASAKKEINLRHGSKIVEEKQYVDYRSGLQQ